MEKYFGGILVGVGYGLNRNFGMVGYS